VCSTHEARLAQLGRLIDEVAAAARAAAQDPGTSAGLAAQLADAWSLLADLDPALALRLAGYQAAGA
jgi:hypothetical protein